MNDGIKIIDFALRLELAMLFTVIVAILFNIIYFYFIKKCGKPYFNKDIIGINIGFALSIITMIIVQSIYDIVS
jgi:Na+/glutamate symporter